MRNASACRGMAVVWVLLTFIAVIGMVGLACDMAYIYYVGQQLQNAADAAALAGGQFVQAGEVDLARTQAQYVAASNCAAQTPVMLELNEENLPDGQIVVGRYNRTTRAFVPTLDGPDAIKVVASRTDVTAQPLPLLFGPIFGTQRVQLTRQAIAFGYGGASGAGLLVLDNSSAVVFKKGCSGDGTLNITNGSLFINSSNRDAIYSSESFTLNVSDIYMVHDYPTGHSPWSKETKISGNMWDGGDGVKCQADPLLPLQAEMNDMLAKTPLSARPKLTCPVGSGNVTIGPGYYPNGIDRQGGSLTLLKGMYILGGKGLKVKGGNITAEGVFLYVRPNNDGTGGDIVVCLQGGGAIRITPLPLQQGTPHCGVSIYQDIRTKTDAHISGNDKLHLEGTLYFPSVHTVVTIADNTSGLFGNQLIVKRLELRGAGVITIDYDGRFSGAAKAFLVE